MYDEVRSLPAVGGVKETTARVSGHFLLLVLSLRWASPVAPPSLSQREMAIA
jgi:hypothetical protein